MTLANLESIPRWPGAWSFARSPLFVVALLVGALAACSEDPAPVETEPDFSDAIEKVSELGPVKATLRLIPKEPKLGDPLILALEVEAEAGVTVEMPSGEVLGRFQIINFVPRQSTRDGKWLGTQIYTLQAPMSGRQRIPPLRIEFADERQGQGQSKADPKQADSSGADPSGADPSGADPSGADPSGADSSDASSDSDDGGLKELLTEEIPIDIASVHADGAVADELGQPAGELEALGAWWHSPLPWVGLVLALALAAGGGFAFRAWRQANQSKVRESAYDVAMARLVGLERRGLPSSDEVDGWYVELSGIIRRYLEDRYSLRAPELTTEEFLYVAQRSGQITSSHRELLSAFLTGCDRVKFARYEPGQEESEQAMESARQFLRETRLKPTSRPPSATDSKAAASDGKGPESAPAPGGAADAKSPAADATPPSEQRNDPPES